MRQKLNTDKKKYIKSVKMNKFTTDNRLTERKSERMQGGEKENGEGGIHVA